LRKPTALRRPVLLELATIH